MTGLDRGEGEMEGGRKVRKEEERERGNWVDVGGKRDGRREDKKR